MTADKIIALVFLCIIGAILLFFLTPRFIKFCEDLGEFIADGVSDLKDEFIETAKEWKDLFKRWTK